jgi:acyl dehydratase
MIAPQVGAELEPLTVASVSAAHMRTLAQVLADPNPIHLDPAAVTALGMGDRVVNQGPANLGYVLDMLAQALPGATVERVAVRFLGNVFAEDALVAGGRVAQSDGERLECEVWLDVVDGARALAGSATLALALSRAATHEP